MREALVVVLEFAHDNHYTTAIERIGIPDEFIEHGSVNELLAEINVTTEETIARITKLVQQK